MNLFWYLLQNICKKRSGHQRNGVNSHLVLCETNPNNLSMLCITICLYCVWHILVNIFLSTLYITLTITSNFLYYIIHFIFCSLKKLSPNWCVWSCWSSHNSRRGEKQEEKYYSRIWYKVRKILSILSIVRESTVRLHKTTWTLGLRTEDVTEDNVWGFLFYQAHQDKRK